jgi:diguanylate cyclase (GGDEF)-like protein/PAS domain S-box-containing protein
MAQWAVRRWRTPGRVGTVAATARKAMMAEYDINEKGEAFLESFEDPGPAFDPADGPPDIWFRRVAEHAGDFLIAFQHDGTIVYVSDQVHFLLGYAPADLVGTNALDLLHPDDLENAAETIYHAAEIEGWRPARPFHLRHADGSFAAFEVEGMSLFHIDDVRSIVCHCRYAESTARVDAIVGLLAAHAPLAQILDELVHVMARPGWRFGVAIQYEADAGGLDVAHTGLPDGLLPSASPEPDSYWARARATGLPVYDVGLETVDGTRAGIAEAHGYRSCWAIPVTDPGRPDACIVVWTAELHEPELGQEILLGKLRQLLELALAGRARATRLEREATTDALSGLANRRSFEATVADDDADGVAVLCLDLDGFKGVNDSLGHAAGDEVIRQVGARIVAEVRHDDLAARLGGDEFAVLCRNVASEDHLHRLAERLLEALSSPIPLPDGQAEVGVSIGVAMAGPGARSDLSALLALADKQLYEAKQRGKGRYQLAHLGGGR